MWRIGETSGTLINGSSAGYFWYDIDMDTDGHLYATASGFSHAVVMWLSMTDLPSIVARGAGPGYAAFQLSTPYG